MSEKLIPCGDRLIVQEIPTEKRKTPETGIYIPDESKKENLIKGKVVAAGPGIRNAEGNLIPNSFKEGDVVVFSKHMGDKYTASCGTKYLIVNALEVMLKIEG